MAALDAKTEMYNVLMKSFASGRTALLTAGIFNFVNIFNYVYS